VSGTMTAPLPGDVGNSTGDQADAFAHADPGEDAGKGYLLGGDRQGPSRGSEHGDEMVVDLSVPGAAGPRAVVPVVDLGLDAQG